MAIGSRPLVRQPERPARKVLFLIRHLSAREIPLEAEKKAV
jgi:hypothetical protein